MKNKRKNMCINIRTYIYYKYITLYVINRDREQKGGREKDNIIYIYIYYIHVNKKGKIYCKNEKNIIFINKRACLKKEKLNNQHAYILN